MNLPKPNCIRCQGTTFHFVKNTAITPQPIKDLNIFYLVCNDCGGIAGLVSNDPKKIKKS